MLRFILPIVDHQHCNGRKCCVLLSLLFLLLLRISNNDGNGFVAAQGNNDAFEWDLEPLDGYPIIAFDQANIDGEVVFKYNYTGTITETKFFLASLYTDDCNTTADAFALTMNEFVEDDIHQYSIDVDVIQDTLVDSNVYEETSDTTALISFCLRVDYVQRDNANDALVRTYNTHRTKVNIDVDLVANFTLQNITTVQSDADEIEARIECSVEAFFCDENNIEIEIDPLSQGDYLQVCVRIDEDQMEEEQLYVKDILRFVVSQPDGPGTRTVNIDASVPDGLTMKICGTLDGICNIKTQLSSKYFIETEPNDLRVDGVALCALGSPVGTTTTAVPSEQTAEDTSSTAMTQGSDIPARRLGNRLENTSASSLRMHHSVPSSEQRTKRRRRMLEGDSPFGLKFPLEAKVMEVERIETNAPTVAPTEEVPPPDYTIYIVILIILILLCCLCCCCGVIIYLLWRRYREEDEDDDEEYMVHYQTKYVTNASHLGMDERTIATTAVESFCDEPLPPQLPPQFT